MSRISRLATDALSWEASGGSRGRARHISAKHEYRFQREGLRRRSMSSRNHRFESEIMESASVSRLVGEIAGGAARCSRCSTGLAGFLKVVCEASVRSSPQRAVSPSHRERGSPTASITENRRTTSSVLREHTTRDGVPPARIQQSCAAIETKQRMTCSGAASCEAVRGLHARTAHRHIVSPRASSTRVNRRTHHHYGGEVKIRLGVARPTRRRGHGEDQGKSRLPPSRC